MNEIGKEKNHHVIFSFQFFSERRVKNGFGRRTEKTKPPKINS